MKSIKRLFNILRESSKNIDFTIIITYIILSLTGLVMIYSASMVMAMQGDYSDPKFYYFSQLKYTVIGFSLVFVMAYFMPLKILKDKRLQLFMIIGIFLALLLTHIFGVEVNGKSRWLEVPFLGRFQPSEFFKIVVILYLAYIYNQKYQKLSAQRAENLLPLLLVGGISCLVLLNDFGTWLLIISIIAGMFLYSGFPVKIIFKVSGILAVILSLLIGVRYVITGNILSGYQRARIETYMHPFSDADGTSYQLTNSLISISHGGLTGAGLGNGIMKLGYLPEPHTDFIFAVIAEELGLIGVIVILLLFIVIVGKAIYYSFKASQRFYSLLCIGIAIYISVQVFLNLGGISGLIPLTGIPLPFLSQGGSSFLSISIAVGLLVLAAKEIKRETEA